MRDYFLFHIHTNKMDKPCGFVVRVSQLGFSLIELSIAIVIMALLVVATLSGKALIHAAQLRSVISEVENYKVQIDNFVTQYEGLPGDINNASSYWSGEDDGNNNGKIGLAGVGSGDEVFDAWRQLALGRFIAGDFSGAGTDAQIDATVPRSRYLPQAGFSLAWYDAPGGWQDALARHFPGNMIVLAADASTENVLEGAALSVEDAFAIDMKIDNDQPDYGKVLASNGKNITGCTDAVAPAAAQYEFATQGVVCVLYFHIE